MDTQRLQDLKAKSASLTIRTLTAELYKIIEAKRQRCVAEVEALEGYISKIPDDFTRQIFILRFVEGLSWTQVSFRLGGWNSEGNLRMIATRYVKREQNADFRKVALALYGCAES